MTWLGLFSTRLDAIVTRLLLTWHGCSWCGKHHGWDHGALLVHPNTPINHLAQGLLSCGYYHLRCWNLPKWFDVEVTRG
jgi:hypothetical protein